MIDKLVRRHPHVFADAVMDDASEAVPRWDKLKRDEMAGTERSILDGVPKAMPALSYAQAIQGRAARMGFDWDDYEGVLDKVAEELREIRDAPEQEREGEIGDLLFTVVNACRWLGIEAESCAQTDEPEGVLPVHHDGTAGAAARPGLRRHFTRREGRVVAGGEADGGPSLLR